MIHTTSIITFLYISFLCPLHKKQGETISKISPVKKGITTESIRIEDLNLNHFSPSEPRQKDTFIPGMVNLSVGSWSLFEFPFCRTLYHELRLILGHHSPRKFLSLLFIKGVFGVRGSTQCRLRQ